MKAFSIQQSAISIVLAALLLTVAAPGRLPAGTCCPGGVCPAPSSPQLTSPWRPARPPATAPSRVDPDWRNNNVVRIEVRDPGGIGFVTGSLVASDGTSAWVLTCWHGFRAGRSIQSVMVRISGGPKTYQAMVVKTDPVWDLGLIRLADPGLKRVPIATEPPDEGAMLRLGGYGYEGRDRFLWITGVLAGRAGPVMGNQRHPADLYRITAAVRSGDSGGPILDTQGRLVSVISCCRPQERLTIGASLERIRAFLGLDSAAPSPPPPIPNPPPPTPDPPPPIANPPPPAPDPCAELRAEIAALRARIEELENRPVATAKPWYLRRVYPEMGKQEPPEPVWPGSTVTLRLFEHPHAKRE